MKPLKQSAKTMTKPTGYPKTLVETLTERPVGVIDIGSNSVRLVIFEGRNRAPSVIFNEKVGCELGREVALGLPLNKERVADALDVLSRFAVISRYYGVSDMLAVATAAVRDAEPESRQAFLAGAEKALGVSIRVLSEAEEACFAAAGVLSGLPWARGIVGDLGGGSLELARIEDGQIHETASLPLGVLRLQPGDAANDRHVAEHVVSELARLPWLRAAAGYDFYAVGGNWRNFARAHMAYRGYPLNILDGYCMHTGEVEILVRAIRKRDPAAMAAVRTLKIRRQMYIRPASVALETLVKTIGARHVVISGHGVREGLVFQNLDLDMRARDPLIEGAYAMAGRMARTVIDDGHVNEWMAPLFDEPDAPVPVTRLTAEERADRIRLRRAASILADVGWGFHTDNRANRTAELVLSAPLIGIDHPGRVFLALTLWYRYTQIQTYEGLLGSVMHAGSPAISRDLVAHARTLGHALHLAFELTGGASDLLQHANLSVKGRRLVLTLMGPTAALKSYDVDKRLKQLAQIVGLGGHELAVA